MGKSQKEREREEARQMVSRTGEILAERGWTRESLRDDHGRVCLLGAFRLAATGGRYIQLVPARFTGQPYQLAHRALLHEARLRGAHNLPTFNDEVAGGMEDVLTLVADAVVGVGD